MRTDELVLWVIAALLAAAILFTIFFTPRRSRHGYGSLGGTAPVLTHAGSLGYRYRQ